MNGILSGLGQAAQQFFYKPQQTGQATAQNSSQVLPMNIKSPVPMTPMTNQLNPGIKSPLANRQVAPHPIQPSIFDQTVQGAQHLGQNIAGLFNPNYASQGHNANTPWPSVARAMQTASTPPPQSAVQQVLAAHTSPNVASNFNPQSYQQGLIRGFTKYGNGKQVPMLQHINTFVQAAQQYPWMQQHPYVLPAISIKESSAGQANAPALGYGVHIGSPADIDSQIMGAAHAIQTMPQYAQFRQTGDPMDLLRVYAPPSENDTATYAQQLPQFMGYFQ